MKPFLTAITALCAFGAGVTGTLLWVENRPAPPAKTTATLEPAPAALPNISLPLAAPPVAPQGELTPDAAPQTGAPEGATAQNESHIPPSNLTSGMAPHEAALELGNWKYDHEKWDEAVQNYRAAIAGGIDNSNVRTDMGNALRFSGHPKEALMQYQIAQKRDPTHEQSLFNQGALYAVSLKNPRKGIEAWQAYLKQFPHGGTTKQARDLIAKFSKAK